MKESNLKCINCKEYFSCYNSAQRYSYERYGDNEDDFKVCVDYEEAYEEPQAVENHS